MITEGDLHNLRLEIDALRKRLDVLEAERKPSASSSRRDGEGETPTKGGDRK